jgi:heme A synthase
MVEISDNITLGLLVVAAAMFMWLAIRSKNWKSFQFQVTIFVMIWIIGEVLDVLHLNNLFDLGHVGIQIHLISMVFLSGILWYRYYTARRDIKKMTERVEDYDS